MYKVTIRYLQAQEHNVRLFLDALGHIYDPALYGPGYEEGFYSNDRAVIAELLTLLDAGRITFYAIELSSEIDQDDSGNNRYTSWEDM